MLSVITTAEMPFAQLGHLGITWGHGEEHNLKILKMKILRKFM